MEIIIEEVTRNHKLLHRHRFKQGQVSIGRGYDNDIILSDPHTCANHLSISSFEGEWVITDHESVNGTLLEKPNNKDTNAHQQTISSGDVIILGKSQLRVIFKEHQVAETIALSRFESFIDLIRHPVSVFTCISLFFIIGMSTNYLNQVTETNISQLLVSALKLCLLFGLWPVGVALISHLKKNDPRVLAQLGISFTFFILIWISDQVERVIVFNSSDTSIVSRLFVIFPIVIAYCLFWLNSYVGFHLAEKRRIVVAIAMTSLLFGGNYLIQYSKKSDFSPYPHYDATLLPPSFALSKSATVDNFLIKSERLFDKAAEEASD